MRSRPLTRLALLGTAAHAAFEPLAGAGIPGASVLGPVGAGATWAVVTGAGMRAAAGRPAADDVAFAIGNGLTLAAALAHYAAWPIRRSSLGLPRLVHAEGLAPRHMPAYNALIRAWATAAIAALALENRRAPRIARLLPLSATGLIARLQRVEFDRLGRQARDRPGWWNRALQR